MKQKDLLFVAVSFFILILIYFGFNIYHNLAVSTISEDTNIQISPIAPSFDDKTISELKKRNNVSPAYQLTPSQTTLVPSPTVLTPSRTASSTATSSGGKL